MDMSYRFTGSDFLDDVSGNYAVSYKDAAANPNDPKYALSNRTPEIQGYSAYSSNYNSNLPVGANYDYDATTGKGTKRGGNYNAQTGKTSLKSIVEKDGYLLMNFTAGYVIKGKNKYYKSKYRNIVNRRKVVKKKTRAKF